MRRAQERNWLRAGDGHAIRRLPARANPGRRESVDPACSRDALNHCIRLGALGGVTVLESRCGFMIGSRKWVLQNDER